MPGAAAPQIITMTYNVDTNFSQYVNLSFPFRVKIGRIWFTADDRLSGGYNNDYEREARLGAVKTRNAKYVGSDNVSDWAPFFGGDDGRWNWDNDLKPYMWLGYPDQRPEGQVIQYDDTWNNDVNWRSTVATPAPFGTKNAIFADSSRPYAHVDAAYAEADSKNPYWDNWGWGSTEEWQEKRYKTDQSILNPDEFLSLFVFNDGGDWSNYVNDNEDNYNYQLAPVTIFVEYTAISGADDSSPTRIWD
jgi:hypothetical protein